MIPRQGRLPRAIDALLVLVAAGLAAWFTLRTPVWGKYDPIPTGWPAGLVYFGAVAWLAAALHRGRARAPRATWVLRLIALAGVTLGTTMMSARLALARQAAAVREPWPPMQELLATAHVNELRIDARLNWALRVGAHASLDRGEFTLPIVVPPEWPYPDDVALAARQVDDNTVHLWARAGKGAHRCTVIIRAALPDTGTSDTGLACAQGPRPAPDSFAVPPHARPAAALPMPEVVGEPWVEYRHDAVRSGATAAGGNGALRGWRVRLDAGFRSSAMGTGDLVVAGTHGSGSIAALDRESGTARWMARAPNWIHQDPVTDGRILVAGFGDNSRSFNGRAPSGAAAWDLATGRHRWTAFDGGSVMTSPVIHGTVVVYATGSGTLLKRDLATGQLLQQDTLPGFVTMAPPALVGDTVVFTLDYGTVCAVLVEGLRRLWCRELSGVRMMGHAAPMIRDGIVVASGMTTLTGLPWRDLVRLPKAVLIRLAREAIRPTPYDPVAGMLFLGLRLRDGKLLWQSRSFDNLRVVDGHTAGTATGLGAMSVIVLPVADTVVGFDHHTGAIRWTASGHGSRGPVLLSDSTVILTGRDGMVHLYDLTTGRLRCDVPHPGGSDRAGPSRIGDLVVFASLDGVLDAVPMRRLARCQAAPLPPGPL